LSVPFPKERLSGRFFHFYAKVRIPYFTSRGICMLAKLTSKNQITLPKAVIDQISVAEYFEVEAVNDSIMLTPVRVEKIKMPSPHTANMESVWAHMEKLGITEQDVQDAVKWARSEPHARA
jgi:hypothetical protein